MLGCDFSKAVVQNSEINGSLVPEAAIMEGSKGSGKFGLNHRSYARMTAQNSPVTETTVRSSQKEHALQN